jgi:hypothetical protein
LAVAQSSDGDGHPPPGDVLEHGFADQFGEPSRESRPELNATVATDTTVLRALGGHHAVEDVSVDDCDRVAQRGLERGERSGYVG